MGKSGKNAVTTDDHEVIKYKELERLQYVQMVSKL